MKPSRLPLFSVTNFSFLFLCLALYFALSLLASTAASAQIYKHTDEDGNTIYSDSPPLDQPNLAPAELPAVIYQPAAAPMKKTQNELDTAKPQRLSIAINTPEQDAYILPVQQNFSVSASLSRKLTEFESITLFVNGKPHGSASKSSSWTVGDLHRGEYSLKVVVTGENNSVTAESVTTTIFVQRHIAR